jgi:hypothetical protein
MNSHHGTNDVSDLALSCFSAVVLPFLRFDRPVVLDLAVSLIIGLLTVVVFRYACDQKTVRRTKDQLKAHLLALRLFQHQLPVVLGSYACILSASGRYLRAVSKPVLLVSVPLTLLLVQLEWYLGSAPLKPGRAFLVTVRIVKAYTPYEASLQLPPGMTITAPGVHISSDNEVVWRVVAENEGKYDIVVSAAGLTFSKHVVVSSGLARLSPVRLRGHLWHRMFVSSEPALPSDSPIQAIAVNYPSRTLHFAWIEWNWLLLLVVLSMIAVLFFKSVLRIEV